MSFWKHLFDSEVKQREDIDEARELLADTSITTDNLRGDLSGTNTRVDQLELLVEALIVHLETRGELTREQLKTLVAQADLADGMEDGRVGEDRSHRAPRCGSCNRPFNRKRSSCVYCGAPPPELPPGRRRGRGR